MLGTIPDILRLLAVPVFAWAAWHDLRTRRVADRLWIPLAVLAVVLLVWDAWAALSLGGFEWRLFAVRATVSLGLVAPLSYLFWRVGGFGGADAKALIVLAVLFPTYPAYHLPWTTLPLEVATLGVFSLTVLTNTALVALVYPFALALRNAVGGRIAPAMFVGRPVDWSRIPTTHGRLLETPSGFTRSGLDLDALRMYFRWRGLTLQEVRANPGRYRDPSTLPDVPNPPTDGAVALTNRPTTDRRSVPDGGRVVELDDDPWGARAFLDDVGSAYGTGPETLRDGLDLLAERQSAWVSPGIPFLVPMFVGLVIGLTYGDLLHVALHWVK